MSAATWTRAACAALAILVAAAEAPGANHVGDSLPHQGDGFNLFDWKLFQKVARSRRGNLLLSPISLKLALVTLYEGAQEETARELVAAMHLPTNVSVTRQKFAAILGSLQTGNAEYSLNLGTRIYLDRSFLPRQSYAATIKSFYDTDVVSANFTDTRATARAINKFVENASEGCIKGFVSDEDSLKDNIMVIVNAMFFKGVWDRQPFSVEHTALSSFFTGDGTVVQVPLMRTSGQFLMVYSKELNAKILRLPYAGNKYSMFIVLPMEQGKLDEVIEKITPFVLNRDLHMWNEEEVSTEIVIPKFKFDFTTHLQDSLRELGIREIFENSATLTGILRSKWTSRRLYVSDIIQKAGIEVNEQGTVAYTATEVQLANKMKDESFRADHPFLFYVEDTKQGTILYAGRVDNPLQESASPQPQLQLPTGRFGPNGVMKRGPPPQIPPSTFDTELLLVVSEAKPGNVVIGTSSARVALMVLAETAVGRTREQIVKRLRLPNNTRIGEAAAHHIHSIKDPANGFELQTASKAWLAKDVQLAKNYGELLHNYYMTNVQLVDFADSVGTANAVNDWVRNSTGGCITDLIQPGSVAPDTRMLLTTAVYFRGAWLKAFDKTATRLGCFNALNIGCQKVALMESVHFYKYGEVEALDAEVVVIPYTGGKVSMIVALPLKKGEQALYNLVRQMSSRPMHTVLESLDETELLLILPRFSVNSKLDLRVPLQQLEIRDLFDNNANLSAAFPAGNVKVSAFVHNAQIEVNEEGTVAAAATGVSVVPLMGLTMTVFRADRPFVFFIYDHQANGILFAGRYVQTETQTPPTA